MKNIIAATLFVVSSPLIASDHQEVFIGTGSSAENARQNAYRSISSQGKPILSFVSSETRQVGTNNFITVFKIKTQ
jgi:hypothetical protein